MSTKQQLISELQKLWTSNKNTIIEESLSNDEDGYENDREFEFGKHGGSWYDRLEENDEGEKIEPESRDFEHPLVREWLEEKVEDRVYDILSDIGGTAKDYRNGELMVYRMLTVPDVEEFTFHVAMGTPLEGYKGLGIYWAFDKNRASAHWGSGGRGGSGDATVHASVPLSSIDIRATLILNLSPSLGHDEAEIRLFEGKPVNVVAVDYHDETYSVEDAGEDPIPMTAKLDTKVKAADLSGYEGQLPPEAKSAQMQDVATDSYDKFSQLKDVSIPREEIPVKEALMLRPYYLGKEEHFMPDACRFPKMSEILKQGIKLKPQFVEIEKVLQEPEYPAVEEFLKETVEPEAPAEDKKETQGE